MNTNPTIQCEHWPAVVKSRPDPPHTHPGSEQLLIGVCVPGGKLRVLFFSGMTGHAALQHDQPVHSESMQWGLLDGSLKQGGLHA